jgi:hypothetical protein
MAKSDYLENALLDHVAGNTTYTPPATFYIALFTTATNDAGGGTEVTGGSYARTPITNNTTNWPDASSGSKSLAVEHTSVTATDDWGTITHMAIMDASSGGNMLYHGALDLSRIVNNGDNVRFAVGSIVITED